MDHNDIVVRSLVVNRAENVIVFFKVPQPHNSFLQRCHGVSADV